MTQRARSSAGQLNSGEAMLMRASVQEPSQCLTPQRPSARRPVLASLTEGDCLSFFKYLDVGALDKQTKAESRNREVHVPPVSVYRWWARRSHAVFAAVIDAAHRARPERFLINDPFSGGATVALQAVLAGDQVYIQDINPWAILGATRMLSLPDVSALQEAMQSVAAAVAPLVNSAYGTSCPDHRAASSQISHTLRVASGRCSRCKKRARMFPFSLLSLLSRRRTESRAWLACPQGHLFVGSSRKRTQCGTCGVTVDPDTTYLPKRKVTCACGHTESISERASSIRWDIVLVERVCGDVRHIEQPTKAELRQASDKRWPQAPDLGPIPDGQEPRVLLRHGFRRWGDLYPARQRHVMSSVLTLTDQTTSEPTVREALRLAVLGVAEMAGYASRWDRFYLKSYESTSNHRFTFTTLSAEPNVWGTQRSGRGTVQRRFRQLCRASTWLHERVPKLGVEALSSTDEPVRPLARDVTARVVLGSSQRQLLPTGVVDLVLTDPPYHDDVQYGELSALFNAWLGVRPNHNDEGEAVVNGTRQRGTNTYRALLTEVFCEAKRTLKQDGHLVLSYANRNPEAWVALADALTEAGYQAAGFHVVHSENERDFSKRDRAACQKDLLLDFVSVPRAVGSVYVPDLEDGACLEDRFLHEVIDWLRQIPALPQGWQESMAVRLARHPFLNSSRTAGHPRAAVNE